MTDQSLLNNGRNTDLELCSGFDSAGNTRGLSMMIEENLDYGNAFVGHVSCCLLFLVSFVGVIGGHAYILYILYII